MNTKSKGEITESIIISKLLILEYSVLLPFGDNQRFDIVAYKEDEFIKIQCKTGRLRNGKILFQSSSKSGGKNRKSYIGQIDMFAVYCFENKESYLVPIKDCQKNTTTIRIDKPKNNSCISKIRWASNYLI